MLQSFLNENSFSANIRIPSNDFSIRVFVGLWFLFSLVIMRTYGGVFYSVLTLPVYKDPIETIEDLERVALNRDYYIVTYPKSYYHQFFANAECCDAYHAIGRALEYSINDIEWPHGIESGVNLVEKSRFMDKNVIFIMTYFALTFGIRSFASIQMHISSEVLMTDQLGMALQKGSPLLKPMDTV